MKNKNIFSSKNWIEKIWQGDKFPVLPKFQQKGLLILNNQQFKKDVAELRKKWKNELKHENEIFNKVLSTLEKEGFYKDWGFKVPDKVILGKVLKKFPEKPFEKRPYAPDLIKLCQKYNLPIGLWWEAVVEYFHDSFLYPPLGNLNCGIFADVKDIKLAMREPALFIQIFPDTTIDDIKGAWKRIKWEQNKLKQKQLKGGYYPLKNLPMAIRLLAIDKNRQLTDWEKAEILYGEISTLDFGLRENKRRKNLKQIRYRYKKLLK